MPICHTCQGEYTKKDCLCPACHQRVGAGREVCPSCGAQTSRECLCPNCKSDVAAWEREKLSLACLFFRQKGILALACPVGVAPLIWLALTVRTGDSIHHPLAGILATGLPLLVFFLLYVSRYQLREKHWEAAVSHAPLFDPGVWFFVSLGSGFGAALIAFVLYKTVDVPTFGWKLVFAAFYGGSHCLLTAAGALLVIRSYQSGLDQRVPQPIFVNPDRLVDLVLKNAAEMLAARVDMSQGNREAMRSFEVLNIVRDQIGCGLQVAVREYRCVRRMDDQFETHPHWIEETWNIQADKWGRIRRLEPASISYKSETREREPVSILTRAPQADLFAGW